MVNRNVVMAVLIATVLLIAGIYIGSRSDNGDVTITPTTAPSVTVPTAGTPETIPTGSTGEETQANIAVTSPTANRKVGKNFNVTGSARVFENVFQVRVKLDSSGEILFAQPAMADAPDTGQFGSFTVPVTLPEKTPQNITVMAGDKITLEIFQYSAKDGSEVDKVVIPLTI